MSDTLDALRGFPGKGSTGPPRGVPTRSLENMMIVAISVVMINVIAVIVPAIINLVVPALTARIVDAPAMCYASEARCGDTPRTGLRF